LTPKRISRENNAASALAVRKKEGSSVNWTIVVKCARGGVKGKQAAEKRKDQAGVGHVETIVRKVPGKYTISRQRVVLKMRKPHVRTAR